MCECILSDTLQSKIPVNSLLKWLSSQKPQDRNLEELEGRKCCQGDFISFFLNFIHEARLCADKSCDFIQSASTPKRIERFRHKCESERAEIKRRPALFQDASRSADKNCDALSERLAVRHQCESAEIKRRPALFEDANEPELPCTTPKRIQNLNESYASPISPLYKPNVTPRSFHQNQKPNLCLGDFITPKLSKKKVHRKLQDEENPSRGPRRINPTNLMNRKCNSLFRGNDNSFNFENEGESDYSCEQRSILREECIRIQRRSSSDVTVMPICKNAVKRREIAPLLKLVTFKEQLDVLTVIYSFMLDHNLVLNLTSELHFIVSLLLSKEYEESVSPNNSLSLGVSLLDLNEEKSVFKSVHNRAYFAANVLQGQLKLLQVLDRATLRLLAENKRFRQFSSEAFALTLLATIEEKNERCLDLPGQVNQNVCFISDTDNRDNFPNDPSFHAFRKQRDLFYETLRIWENNHLHEEWNFTVALGGKIKALLNMYPDPANLVHFARLFKAQLLMNSCGKNEEDLGETQLAFLSSIPNVDAEKLLRLKNRIVGKQAGGGINSVPIFSGYHEFYKDFLLVAANHIFNRHLKDALIAEIVELNDTKFTCSDFDDNDGSLDVTTKNAYVLCVKSLRILAKFLGFVESLPYKSDYAQVSQNVVTCHINIRNGVQPNLNLKKMIEKSRENKMLILTVPWAIKYLAMLDYLTLRLSCFKQVHHFLFEIYYNLRNEFGSNALLVKLCLGWLFELPHFPEDMYYTWLSERLTRKSKNVNSLGELNMVDQNVIYICCPFLQEIKKVLTSDCSFSNGNTIKHITPLTAVESPSDLSKKRLQLQLEEAFFNSQPVSIRKTVEFVSERVASACVKEICNEIVPASKKRAVAQLKETLASLTLPEDSVKPLLQAKSAEIATACLRALRGEIDERLRTITGTRIPAAIEALLASDVLQQTKDVCVTITDRVCLERTQQWVNSHVNVGVFTRDFDAETKAILHPAVGPKSKFSLPEFGKDMAHDETALSGYKLVDDVRTYSWMVLERAPLARDSIVELLRRSHRSITARCDLNDCILALINKMLLELALLLIAHRPELLSEEVIALFLRVWRESNPDGLFENLICPRNVSLLSHSQDPNVWRAFREFAGVLVRENLVTYDKLTLGQNVEEKTPRSLTGLQEEVDRK